jgi:hypothetical protein
VFVGANTSRVKRMRCAYSSLIVFSNMGVFVS